MKNTSTIVQLLALVSAAALVFAFVLPKFEDIRALQDDIALYLEQSENIEQINAQLQGLVAEVNSVSASDQRALATFLPDSVDEISVLRTLQNIADLSMVETESLDFSGSDEVEGRNVASHNFEFAVVGSYEVVTNFFSLLEQNEYLFEVIEAEFTVGEFGEIQASGVLATYSFLLLEENEEMPVNES